MLTELRKSPINRFWIFYPPKLDMNIEEMLSLMWGETELF